MLSPGTPGGNVHFLVTNHKRLTLEAILCAPPPGCKMPTMIFGEGGVTAFHADVQPFRDPVAMAAGLAEIRDEHFPHLHWAGV